MWSRAAVRKLLKAEPRKAPRAQFNNVRAALPLQTLADVALVRFDDLETVDGVELQAAPFFVVSRSQPRKHCSVIQLRAVCTMPSSSLPRRRWGGEVHGVQRRRAQLVQLQAGRLCPRRRVGGDRQQLEGEKPCQRPTRAPWGRAGASSPRSAARARLKVI